MKLFEVLESRQLFSAGVAAVVTPVHATASELQINKNTKVQAGLFFGSATRSDGQIAATLEMKLEYNKGIGRVTIRTNERDQSHQVLKFKLDTSGQFTYTMTEATKTRVITGGLNSDASVFSGNFVETDNTTGEQTGSGTFRLVRMNTKTSKPVNFNGVVSSTQGQRQLKLRLTHLDSGYLAEAAVKNPNGIEMVCFNVAEDGTFSFDKSDNDGGTTHIQGAFATDFKTFAGTWSSTHGQTTESGDFSGWTGAKPSPAKNDKKTVDPRKTTTTGGDQKKSDSTTPSVAKREFKGATTIAGFSVALKITLTKTETQMTANFKLGGDRATGDGVSFIVNSDGTFSADIKGADGTTHIQGQFSADFASVSGSWSSLSNTGNANGSSFSATLVS